MFLQQKAEFFPCSDWVFFFSTSVYLSILKASPLHIMTKVWLINVHNRWVAAQSIFYHLYNQVSYMSLDEISPLTFSIGNTMKRISVIVSSIIIFHTPVQPVNALGAAIAVFGTFLYSQVFFFIIFYFDMLHQTLWIKGMSSVRHMSVSDITLTHAVILNHFHFLILLPMTTGQCCN